MHSVSILRAAYPMTLDISPTFQPVLDPGFVPAALWNRAYLRKVRKEAKSRDIHLALCRPDGTTFRWEGRILSSNRENDPLTLRYLERHLKFLLWQKGGNRVLLSNAPEMVSALSRIYSHTGARAFDWDILGNKIFGAPITVESAEISELPQASDSALSLGGHLDGCRIGFDLGGSDRKCAALIDGKVVFSEEVPWDPCFQNDPGYHIDGIHHSLLRAAAHLPRVDAIGGSAAGVYVNNEVRAASLFRGIGMADFETHIRRIFYTLKERWGNVPFQVVNDGEVTALAGSMNLQANDVLGIAMGTSEAAGYVDSRGQITPWLNELAFAPVDFRDPARAPVDEWSGDHGCGGQYFSQQAVARLAPIAGFNLGHMPFPDQLSEVQEALKAGDTRAGAIYETIGTYFGYTLAHYADYYDISNLLVLGRVTSGEGGDVMINEAETILATDFPDLHIKLVVPDETTKRHGQAVTAASLAEREVEK